MSELAKQLLSVAEDDRLLEVARRAIEDALIELRDSRISTPRHNGLVVAERDGTPSEIIRLGSEDAVRIGLKAIAADIANGGASPTQEDAERAAEVQWETGKLK